MTAAKMGLSDSLIKTLGHWKSSAFESYIRTPQGAVSATLIALCQAIKFIGGEACTFSMAGSNKCGQTVHGRVDVK